MPPMKAEAGLEVMEDTKGELARPVKDGDEISIGYWGEDVLAVVKAGGTTRPDKARTWKKEGLVSGKSI